MEKKAIIKPAIRYKGYTDDWKEYELNDIVEYFPNPVPQPTNGYWRLGIRSHAKGTFYSYVEKGKELEAAQMHKVEADKLIMNITFAWEHAVAITTKEDAGKLVSHRFPQFSFKGIHTPDFYKYVIIDERFRHHLWLSSPGGAGRNRVLKINEMLKYRLYSTTDTSEQTKIADFFQHLDILINNREIKLKTLKNLRNTCLSKMFPKKWK